MKIKLLLFGEAVNIPHTSIGLGVGLISVWMDGRGFTSASNDLGALGYILLETQEVDVGDLDDERQRLFSNLHGQVVTFGIKPNLFVRSGGIARITMSMAVNQAGRLSDKKIEFMAEDCTGISLVTNALAFSTTMLQLERRLADLESTTIVSEDGVDAIASAAPPGGSSAPA